MPRKQNTIELQIAQEYRLWLHRNPNASKRRRILEFDKIADKYQTKQAA